MMPVSFSQLSVEWSIALGLIAVLMIGGSLLQSVMNRNFEVVSALIGPPRGQERYVQLKNQLIDLRQRMHSWWIMLAAVSVALVVGPLGITAFFALCAMQACREVLSHTPDGRQTRQFMAITLFGLIPLGFGLVALGDPALGFLLVSIVGLAALCLNGGTTNALLSRTVVLASTLSLMALSQIAFASTPLQPGIQISDWFIGVGSMFLLHLLIVAQASDALQYSFGKSFGRTPLAPKISPNKTWEGAIGGAGTATLLGTVLALTLGFSLWQAILVSLITAALGIAGGLLSSAIKRKWGIKDWSHLIPGHGGVLDRIDSLVLAAPAYLMMTLWFQPGVL